MSKNFNDISLKDRGSAYSDTVECKGDGTYVYTFQIFTGWEKKMDSKLKHLEMAHLSLMKVVLK